MADEKSTDNHVVEDVLEPATAVDPGDDPGEYFQKGEEPSEKET